MGLGQPEIEGIRAALLYRAVAPDNTTKLSMVISLMPAQQVVSVQAFMDDITTLRLNMMQRGQTALLAMSDEEWNAMLEGTGDGQDYAS